MCGWEKRTLFNLYKKKRYEKGVTDFYQLLSRLRDVGFDGALILEAYQQDYGELDELISSVDYVKNLSSKIFK